MQQMDIEMLEHKLRQSQLENQCYSCKHLEQEIQNLRQALEISEQRMIERR